MVPVSQSEMQRRRNILLIAHWYILEACSGIIVVKCCIRRIQIVPPLRCVFRVRSTLREDYLFHKQLPKYKFSRISLGWKNIWKSISRFIPNLWEVFWPPLWVFRKESHLTQKWSGRTEVWQTRGVLFKPRITPTVSSVWQPLEGSVHIKSNWKTEAEYFLLWNETKNYLDIYSGSWTD